MNDQWSLDTGSCMMKIDQQKARAHASQKRIMLSRAPAPCSTNFFPPHLFYVFQLVTAVNVAGSGNTVRAIRGACGDA